MYCGFGVEGSLRYAAMRAAASAAAVAAVAEER